MSKRQKSHTPETQGYYWSYEERMTNAAPETLKTYYRSSEGVWFANGVQVAHEDVPADLWRVREVQS